MPNPSMPAKRGFPMQLPAFDTLRLLAILVAVVAALGASISAPHPLHSAVSTGIHLLASSSSSTIGGGGGPTQP